MAEIYKSITLQHPIQFGDKTVNKLDIRKPKAGDFRMLKNLDQPFGMMLDLAAELSGLPASVLDDLEADDLPAVMEVMSGFLHGFQGTGKTS